MRNHIEVGSDDQALLTMLLDLPNKILNYHEVNGLAQMILHDVSHDEHFSFRRASYLIDNPAFDCFRGIAGYVSDECKHHHQNLWQDPHTFAYDMREAKFHNILLQLGGKSIKNKGSNHLDVVRSVAYDLGMSNPWVYPQELRHGNYGILIVEEGNKRLVADDHELLSHISAILGLCHA
jgi:hypothetical protein